jgi:hypothetical protein
MILTILINLSQLTFIVCSVILWFLLTALFSFWNVNIKDFHNQIMKQYDNNSKQSN